MTSLNSRILFGIFGILVDFVVFLKYFYGFLGHVADSFGLGQGQGQGQG